MSESDQQTLTSDQKREIATAWADSVEKTRDAQTQALIGGLNFRVNVAKAFRAAWTTAKICFTAKKIALTGSVGPADIIGIATDIYTAVVSTLDALRERMHPLEYTACIVLSGSHDLTPTEFEQQLTEFLVAGSHADLPWYIGLTRFSIQLKA
jgi:hypothetical protein